MDGISYYESVFKKQGLAAVCVVTNEFGKEKVSEEWDFFEKGKYSHTIKDTRYTGGRCVTEKYVKP